MLYEDTTAWTPKRKFRSPWLRSASCVAIIDVISERFRLFWLKMAVLVISSHLTGINYTEHNTNMYTPIKMRGQSTSYDQWLKRYEN